MDCDSVDASTCSVDPDVTFDVDGHTLTWSLVQSIDSLGSCELSLDARTFVVDDGETGTWGFHFEFPMSGDEEDCQALDDAIAAEDPDGHGFADCLAELDGEVELDAYETQ